MRKKNVMGLLMGLMLMTSAAFAGDAQDPQTILSALKEGNDRFVKHETLVYKGAQALKDLASQKPNTVVITCMDSRVAPEFVFDQPMGSMLVNRLAGNIVTRAVSEGTLFGVNALGARLIILVGHSNCGAIQAACATPNAKPYRHVLDPISPSVNKLVKTKWNRRACSQAAFLQDASWANLESQAQRMFTFSPSLKKKKDQKKIDVVLAMYDQATGRVEFRTM